MRQALTNDFWGLHKNMNCAFPLKLFYTQSIKNDKSFLKKKTKNCLTSTEDREGTKKELELCFSPS